MPSLDSSQQASTLASAPANGPATTPSADEQVPIRVVIAMPTEFERMAWAITVSSQADMQLVAQVASCEEALAVLNTHRSDVTLIDQAILDAGRYEMLQTYAHHPLSTRFVLIAPHQIDYSLEPSRYALAHAYLLKGVSAEELLKAIRSAAGEHRS